MREIGQKESSSFSKYFIDILVGRSSEENEEWTWRTRGFEGFARERRGLASSGELASRPAETFGLWLFSNGESEKGWMSRNE